MKPLQRREFLKTAAAAELGVALAPWWARAAETPHAKPNIVMILADDWGYGDAKCYNPTGKILTPNIDRLAREGMRFTDAHAAAAVCTPTRYGLLTGRYPWRTRLQNGVLMSMNEEPLIAEGRMTVPSLLKQSGYRTGMFGKWHLGQKSENHNDYTLPMRGGPVDRGFDYFIGTESCSLPPYVFIENDRYMARPTENCPSSMKDKLLHIKGGPMAPGWKWEDRLSILCEKAGNFIRETAKSGEPFFVYFAPPAPHYPVTPSERFKGKSGINLVADWFMETDWAFGEVLRALDEAGVNDNTLVIFAADNGHDHESGMVDEFAQVGHKVSGPHRGVKASGYDGGHREPFVVRWPGVVKPGSDSDALVSLNSLMATCADILGMKLPENAGEDSFSILPLLKGGDSRAHEHPHIITQSSMGQLSVRQGQWKYIAPPHLGLKLKNPKGESEGRELYDLVADPGEKNNLHVANKEKAEELHALLERLVAQGRTTPGEEQANDVPIELVKQTWDQKK